MLATTKEYVVTINGVPIDMDNIDETDWGSVNIANIANTIEDSNYDIQRHFADSLVSAIARGDIKITKIGDVMVVSKND